MSKPKTVEQWLKEKDLPTELGRVLAPGKHIWEESAMKVEGLCNFKYRCKKCFMRVAESAKAAHENDCRVDSITIDWNTAMEWRDKALAGMTTAFTSIMYDVYEASPCSGSMEFAEWMAVHMQASDMLIAVALAKKGMKNETG